MQTELGLQAAGRRGRSLLQGTANSDSGSMMQPSVPVPPPVPAPAAAPPQTMPPSLSPLDMPSSGASPEDLLAAAPAPALVDGSAPAPAPSVDEDEQPDTEGATIIVVATTGVEIDKAAIGGHWDGLGGNSAQVA